VDAVAHANGDGAPDLVPIRTEITATYAPGSVRDVRMHDGSTVRLRKIDDDFEHGDRDAVYAYIRERQRAGEVPTGLLYMEPGAPGMHDMEGTIERPLTSLDYTTLCPGSVALDALMEEFR
jgi:2-oxoglutarate ferredoxin oxidoreductase subunit beta